MPRFPSVDWFRAVRDVYNSDASLHSGGGGACFTTSGFRVNGENYLIVFEGEQVADITAATDAEMQECDFIIEMPFDLWKEMVASVQERGRADLHYTLNSIDLSREDGIARSPTDDQYRQDLFYRYNQNFQDFFNASARVPTTF